nr:diphthine--ammonia ligase [bacterium]
MKFVTAFSTGKDSMLALHRMVAQGHTPVGLLVMFNTNVQRSWFHGADEALLGSISKALRIPLWCGYTDGSDYNTAMEKALANAREWGAEACVFGDIDIQGHRCWNEERCQAAGIKAQLPLWNENRQSLVREVVHAGYKCLIKCVHPEKLPECFLGKTLDDQILLDMQQYGIDLCGENGEYHTIVVDGPLFHHPVDYRLGKILRLEHVSAIEIDTSAME